jgi:hypothetical protein
VEECDRASPVLAIWHWAYQSGVESSAVEEQPAASTTATASITAGNAGRLMWSKKKRRHNDS